MMPHRVRGLMGKLAIVSGVLLGLCVLFMVYFARVDAYEQYHRQLSEQISSQRLMMRSLLSQQAVKLRSYGEMLLSLEQTQEALTQRNKKRLHQALAEFALSIPPDSGLELFRLYDENKFAFAQSGIDRVGLDANALRSHMGQARGHDHMIVSLACGTVCRQTIVLPVFDGNGAYFGSLLLMSDISNVLAEFIDITGAALGIAVNWEIRSTKTEKTAQERLLPGAKLYLSEIANYPQMHPLLTALDAHDEAWFRVGSTSDTGYLYTMEQKAYVVHAWPISDQGHWAIVVNETSADLQAIGRRLWKTTFASVAIVALAIVMLSLYMLTDVRRINYLGSLMPHLADSRFAQLRQGLAGKRFGQRGGDEIDRLRYAIEAAADRQEALLAARNEADERTRRKTRYLAQSAHDMRNLVAPMSSLLNTLVPAMDAASFDRVVRALCSCAANLHALAQDAIDIDKIERGLVVCQDTEFNPLLLIEEVFDALSYKAREKGLRAVMVAKSLPPAVVSADQYKFRKIVINLLDNAVKYTTQGSIGLLWEVRRFSETKGALFLQVIDSGSGIAKENVERIFGDYSRLSDAHEGYGIGLFIARQYAELMHGSIDVKPSQQGGSEFTLFFPVGLVGDDADNRENTPPFIEILPSGVSLCAHTSDPRTPDHRTLVAENLSREAIAKGTACLQQVGRRLLLANSRFSARQLIDFSHGSIIKTRGKLDRRMIGCVARAHSDLSRSGFGQGAAMRPLRLLVADDSEPVRMALCGFLQARGHQCVQASDGAQAIDLLANDDFDGVILDQQMPCKTGTEVAKWCKEIRKSNAAILLCTADVGYQTLEATWFDALVTKPVDIQYLISTIETSCQGVSRHPALFNAMKTGVSDIGVGHLFSDQKGEALEKKGIEARLMALVTMLGRERSRTIVTRFFESAKEYINEIETSQAAGDTHRVYEILHTLLAASGTIHADHILQRVKTLYTPDETPQPIDITLLRTALGESERVFKKSGLL